MYIFQEYQSNEEFKKWVRLFLALPHIPHDSVGDTFAFTIMATAPFVTHPASQQFADYFSTTWLENDSYPIEMWNQYGVEHRTTNAAEGWHNKINDKVSKSHPNVFDLVKILRQEQESVDLSIVQLTNGSGEQQMKKKYRTLKARHNRLRERFEQNEISVTQLLYAISNLYGF